MNWVYILLAVIFGIFLVMFLVLRFKDMTEMGMDVNKYSLLATFAIFLVLLSLCLFFLSLGGII